LEEREKKMSEKKPLLSRRICINDDYDITLGRLFFSFLIALLQALMILATTNWVFTSAVFSCFLVAITSIRKRQEKSDSQILKKLISIEERLEKLEKKTSIN